MTHNSPVDNSLIIPLYKSAEGISQLFDVLEEMQEMQKFEIVFVDDGSPDNSRQLVIDKISKVQWECKVICHARNFGSFEAIRTGFAHANGKYLAFMAADMQEPPELLHEIFKTLQADKCDIVIGKRISREDSFKDRLLSGIFWWAYRNFINSSIPVGGVDVFGCTKQVACTLLELKEKRSSLLAQLFWIGYNKEFIEYNRKQRVEGKSSWTFKRKLSYMADSIFSFTDLPLKILAGIGISGLLGTVLIAFITLMAKVLGYIQVPGYATLIFVITGSTALNLTGLGIVGGYVWRTYENSKERPLSIVSLILNNK
jgi:glycosyltransferase involved in cell wall biosynthesis